MRIPRTLALLLLALTAPLEAQNRTETGEVPVFRLLGLGVHGEGLCYLLDGVDVPVTVGEDFRSPFYQRPATPALALHRLETRPDGTAVRTPVASVTIPAGMKYPLVVLMKGSEGITAQVVDDGPDTLPGGSFRVFNRLDYDVGLVAGGEPTVLPRLSDVTIRGKPAGGGRTIFIQLIRLGTPDRRLLFSNNWAFSELVRTLVVVAPPRPPSELPVVRRIVEPLDALSNPQPIAVSGPPSP